MKVRWTTPLHGGTANTVGYGTLIRRLHDSLLAAGVTIDPAARVALHVEPPLTFYKRAGTAPVLFSMWEQPEIAPQFRPHLGDAELLVVPCRDNVEIFRQYTDAPIKVCPLGVTPAEFPTARRVWSPGQPFVFLWVGAPNARKGYDSVQDAFNFNFYDRPGVHLYLKTTGGTPENVDKAVFAGWSRTSDPLVVCKGNVTLDMRHVSTAELARIYAEAHCLLFPSAGEGWGLHLHEALATGLPAICTAFGGYLDYVSDATVTLVPYEVVERRLEEEDAQGKPTLSAETFLAPRVHPRDLTLAMLDMMRRYPEHLRKARLGAQQVRQLTWTRTGKRLARLLADFSTTRLAA